VVEHSLPVEGDIIFIEKRRKTQGFRPEI